MYFSYLETIVWVSSSDLFSIIFLFSSLLRIVSLSTFRNKIKSITWFEFFNILKNSNQVIDLILFLKVDKETILKRLEKRKIIENRSDDDTHTIVSRYEKYMETTQPVLNFYSENPNFKEIDGSLEIEEITRKIDAFVNV